MKGVFAKAVLVGFLVVPYVACGVGGSSSTPPTTKYTLTVQASPSGGGTVAVSPSQSEYASGTVVTLSATAASGYAFSNWTGDAVGATNPTTVTMNGNKTVTANFIAGPTYTLTVQASPSSGGNVVVSPSQAVYASGTVVTLTAIAASGYAFSNWTGDATGATNPATVTMNGDKTVTANFIVAPTYTLTVQVSPLGWGTVAVSPSQAEYASGTVVTLTATAASGYAFSNWTGDVTGTANPTTVTMNGNKTVTANFAFYKYFAYVVNETIPGIVSGYTINSTTGALAAIAASPFAAGSNPYSIAVDPTGNFVYVANGYSYDVSGYTIDSATGALTAIAASPFAAGSNPVFVAIDPKGKFVYVVNEYSNDVSGYTINSTTGALAAIAASPFAAGSNPYSMAVDPTGKFAYVVNLGSWTLSAYTINSTTGALTPIPGSPYATGSQPWSVAVDPTGKFAYVANAISFNISGYTINSSTGALTAMPGSPFATEANAVFIAVDPTGKFAYVANFLSSNISAYSIDSITGALTPIAGSPYATGGYPCSIATIRIRQ